METVAKDDKLTSASAMINPLGLEADLKSEMARIVGLAKLKTRGKLHDSFNMIPGLPPGTKTAL